MLGQWPYAQWQRFEPNFVHPDFVDLKGYPFLEARPADADSTWYVDPSVYDKIFSDQKLAHWNIQGKVNIEHNSPVPGPKSSIFAGAN